MTGRNVDDCRGPFGSICERRLAICSERSELAQVERDAGALGPLGGDSEVVFEAFLLGGEEVLATLGGAERHRLNHDLPGPFAGVLQEDTGRGRRARTEVNDLRGRGARQLHLYKFD